MAPPRLHPSTRFGVEVEYFLNSPDREAVLAETDAKDTLSRAGMDPGTTSRDGSFWPARGMAWALESICW
jgi:hypothetical protein